MTNEIKIGVLTSLGLAARPPELDALAEAQGNRGESALNVFWEYWGEELEAGGGFLVAYDFEHTPVGYLGFRGPFQAIQCVTGPVAKDLEVQTELVKAFSIEKRYRKALEWEHYPDNNEDPRYARCI